MANFAYIVDGQIDSVYDKLPQSWGNISNFFTLESDESRLNELGWYKITKIIHDYNPETQRLAPVRRWIENGIIYETEDVEDLPPIDYDYITSIQDNFLESEWENVRQKRDALIEEFDWRYLRYDREIRLGMTPTDDINAMDIYIQQLADIPETQTDPFNIVWPSYGVNE